MRDTLLAQREYFDERLKKLPQINNLEERYQYAVDLVYDEEFAEFAYRSGLIRGKIIGLGLEKSMSYIVDGMNKSSSKVLPSDLTSLTSAKHYQENTRAYSDAFLRFALDYVDRWVMYNNLFNQEK